jgi:hypothetical protein
VQLGRRNRVAGEDHLLGHGQAHVGRQQRRVDDRRDADLHLREAEHTVRSGQTDVARQGQLEGGAEAVSVDHGCRGQGRGADQGQAVTQSFDERPGGGRVEVQERRRVDSGRERAVAGAGERQGPDRRSGIGHEPSDLRDVGRGQRVQLGGPVEHDPPHVADDVGAHRRPGQIRGGRAVHGANVRKRRR